MFEKNYRTTVLAIKLKPEENLKIRSIASAYGVSLAEVIRQLMNTQMTLQQMHDLATDKHNIK